MEREQSCEEVVAVHDNMDEGVESQHGHHGWDGGDEVAPISEEGDAAVMEDVEQADLSSTMSQYHEHSV